MMIPHLKRMLGISPCLLALSSCLLGPNPDGAEIALPGSIRGDQAPHGRSFGDQSWRKVFSDPTLRSLIEHALENNPDLAAATYRIEEARAQANIARSAFFPQISAGADATSNQGSVNANQVAPGRSRHSEAYNLSGYLSWEIDLWGRITRSNQAARAQLLGVQFQRDAVQTMLVAAVATAYVDLKNLDERLAITRRTVESRRASLELVRARREGGVSSDMEVRQAESLLAQAEVLIPTTELAMATKENELRALLNEYPGKLTRAGRFDQLDRAMKIQAGLPSSLIARRPDVAAADQRFRAATAEIGVNEALRYPSLTLTGRAGAMSADLSSLLESQSSAYSFGPSLLGPVIDGGNRRARVVAARARAQAAMADYDQAVKQAFREASNSIIAYHKSGQIITEQEKLVTAQSGAASLSAERFKGGVTSYLEVLDSERNLFNSELALADARADRQRAVVQAYRALGGGWK
jgi:multidrug efflux system outer membrane protein